MLAAFRSMRESMWQVAVVLSGSGSMRASYRPADGWGTATAKISLSESSSWEDLQCVLHNPA